MIDEKIMDQIAYRMQCADDTGWTRMEIIKFILEEYEYIISPTKHEYKVDAEGQLQMVFTMEKKGE